MLFTEEEEQEALASGKELHLFVHPMIGGIGVRSGRGTWRIIANYHGGYKLLHMNEAGTMRTRKNDTSNYHLHPQIFPTIPNAMLYIKNHDNCRYTHDRQNYAPFALVPKDTRRDLRRAERALGKHPKDKARYERHLRIRELATL